jgi:predicted ATPase
MLCTLHFETPAGANTYHHRLVHAAPATLIFADERTVSHTGGRVEEVILGSGHRESLLPRRAEDGDRTARVIHHLLGGCRVFQFHDTSERANIRQEGYIEDNRYLRHDAGNLAAFLRGLRETKPDYYGRIIATIQQIAPFFRDFDLEPSRVNPRQILLNWRERDSDFLFGPHQLSDGTLRTMALITLLLQPEDDLPDVILLDEPELGLHPSAIQLLASLLRAAASRRQVIAATQSATLVDQFDPEEVVVVERGDTGSIFRRLSSEPLRDWLDQYALGELWQKNVIGGRP